MPGYLTVCNKNNLKANILEMQELILPFEWHSFCIAIDLMKNSMKSTQDLDKPHHQLSIEWAGKYLLAIEWWGGGTNSHPPTR